MDKYQVRTDLATEIIKDSGLVEEEKNINGYRDCYPLLE